MSFFRLLEITPAMHLNRLSGMILSGHFYHRTVSMTQSVATLVGGMLTTRPTITTLPRILASHGRPALVVLLVGSSLVRTRPLFEPVTATFMVTTRLSPRSITQQSVTSV